ncbi:MAG TPA: polysaccharide deacetylase family protein [Pyrinomonadaceae bacterium]
MRLRRIALIVSFAFAAFVAAAGQSRPERRVAVTFDDLPMSGGGNPDGPTVVESNRKIVAVLAANKIPAVGFVNERQLEAAGQQEERRAALRMWVEAGLELGNHTYSHKYFYNTPLAEFQQEVIKGEPFTRQLLSTRGMKLRYFRHPFLNTGRTVADKQAFEKFLSERGYTVAPVTHDNMEWVFAREYAKALVAKDDEKARRVAAEYVPYMERMFEFYEQLSVELFGREIPQVLLVHANLLNGDHFQRMVEMMKRRGYRFVTLEDALKDESYKHQDAYAGPVGISWLQRWLVTRGREFRKEPYLPEYMRQFDSPRSSGSDFKSRPGR